MNGKESKGSERKMSDSEAFLRANELNKVIMEHRWPKTFTDDDKTTVASIASVALEAAMGCDLAGHHPEGLARAYLWHACRFILTYARIQGHDASIGPPRLGNSGRIPASGRTSLGDDLPRKTGGETWGPEDRAEMP